MVYPQQFFTPINPDIIKFDIVYETLIRKQDSDLEMQFSQDERIQIKGDITGKFDSGISQLVLDQNVGSSIVGYFREMVVNKNHY